jgi:hypothetical protein
MQGAALLTCSLRSLHMCMQDLLLLSPVIRQPQKQVDVIALAVMALSLLID